MDKGVVLIVDDSILNRELMRRVLEPDYAVIQAENGEEAINLLGSYSKEITIVLLDIVMPKKDGFDVLKYMARSDDLTRIPVIIITGENSEKTVLQGYELGAVDIIHKPFNPVVVRRRVDNVTKLYKNKFQLESILNKQVKTMGRQAKKLENNNRRILDALSTVIEFRDCESGMHLQRIRSSTKLLLEAMSIEHPEYHLMQDQIETIAKASSMHDIGKIAIPDSILNKPDKLTEQEYELMKTHTTKGCEILSVFNYSHHDEYFSYAHEICLHHHERWDGMGYPDGLRGDEIPIWSQVVAIVDAYDALISARVYKPAIEHNKAVEMIVNGECGCFNPEVIGCFLRVAGDIGLTGIERKQLQYEPSISRAAPKYHERERANTDTPCDQNVLFGAEREKYRVLFSLCEGSVFYLDLRTQSMHFSQGYKDMFDDGSINSALMDPLKGELLQSSESGIINSRVKGLTRTVPSVVDEILLRNKHGGYEWFELTLTAMYNEHDQNKLIGYMGKLSPISQREGAAGEDEEIGEVQETDSLTGLYTRETFAKMAMDILSRGYTESFVIIVADIDNFKEVNESLGYLFGDEVLRLIGYSFKKTFRSYDIVGRFEGDEFAVLMRNFVSKADVLKRVRELGAFLSDITNRGTVSYPISCSVGIACYPEDGMSLSELLARALSAVQAVKSRGGNDYEFYQSGGTPPVPTGGLIAARG